MAPRNSWSPCGLVRLLKSVCAGLILVFDRRPPILGDHDADHKHEGFSSSKDTKRTHLLLKICSVPFLKMAGLDDGLYTQSILNGSDSIAQLVAEVPGAHP